MTAEERRAANHRNYLQKMDKYHRDRAALIATMGGKCAICGSTERLEFDHYPFAATWVNRKKSCWQRMNIFRREYAEGKLRLLCRRCNATFRPELATADRPNQERLELVDCNVVADPKRIRELADALPF